MFNLNLKLPKPLRVLVSVLVLLDQKYISLPFVSGWISRSESSIVEVQPGENATLLCSKLSSFPTHTVWFRLVNRTQPCCISIYNSIEPPSFCDGVDQEKFEVTSNFSTIFLKIKHVDLSDAGFYFCGYYTNGLPVIVNSMDLQVQGKNGEIRNNKENEIRSFHHSQIEMW